MTKLQVQTTKPPAKPPPDNAKSGTVVNIQNVEIQRAPVRSRGRHGNCLSWCALALLVGVVLVGFGTIFGLVYWYYFAPVDCNKPDVDARGDMREMTTFGFDDIWDPTYRPRGFNGYWTTDADGSDVLVYRADDGSVYKDSGVSPDNRTLLLRNTTLEEYGTGTYFFSHDLQYALLAWDIHSVWRHSFRAKYGIIEVESGDYIEFPTDPDLQDTFLQYARWAPNSNDLTFVVDNDLYYQHGLDGSTHQLTYTGEERTIFNGIPDWLYEEDVISSNVAHYWSPESSWILYATFNDTEVVEQEFAWYGDNSDVYGRTEKIAYPKAGYLLPDGSLGPNTKVELHAQSIAEDGSPGNIQHIPPPEEFVEEFYYTRVAWQDDDHVMIVWTTRLQNEAHIKICDMTQDPVECESHREVTSPAWIDAPYAAPLFIDNGHRYLSIFPSQQGEDPENLWRHLQLSDLSGTSEESHIMLTEGEVEITSIVGYSEEDHRVYFISTNGDPKERHLMWVSVPEMEPMPTDTPTEPTAEPTEPEPEPDTTAPADMDTTTTEETSDDPPVAPMKQPRGPIAQRRVRRDVEDPECVTCDPGNEACRFVSASLSPSGKFYTLRCLGPSIPTYTIRSTDTDEEMRVLESNSAMLEALASKQLPGRMFETFEVEGEDGEQYEAEVEIFLPYGYSAGKSYPLLVYAYAGPGSQRVSKRYDLGSTTNGWLTHMKSEHQVVVASVDGRGTGLKGDKFMHLLYEKMGTIEMDDQITGGKFLREKGYVRTDKQSAIFGWSGGGFASSHVLSSSHNDAFHCALAVAPTTHMGMYDTAYTERYMGFANQNVEQYNNTIVMNKVHNFKDKKYFLAHGTADDNVHFMHAAHLVKALAEAEIQYSYHMYVDENHGIGSFHQSRHLFRAMTDFLVHDCFQLEEEEPPTEDGATSLAPFSALLLAALAYAYNNVN